MGDTSSDGSIEISQIVPMRPANTQTLIPWREVGEYLSKLIGTTQNSRSLTAFQLGSDVERQFAGINESSHLKAGIDRVRDLVLVVIHASTNENALR